MLTQIDHAKNGTFTPKMQYVAKQESMDENTVLFRIAERSLVIMVRENDVVLSPGNTMRSGCIHDPCDPAQLMEMQTNANLANKAGVQAIIEGMGGHVPASVIPELVELYKLLSQYPLFVADPLPTDVALGYDHIAGAVGATMASGAGADYLCYITPSEHLSLPTLAQVHEGLVAFKLALTLATQLSTVSLKKNRLLAEKRAHFD
jgi:phosphomethylpyrimidine synthase